MKRTDDAALLVRKIVSLYKNVNQELHTQIGRVVTSRGAVWANFRRLLTQ